jgi:hypothetical protein
MLIGLNYGLAGWLAGWLAGVDDIIIAYNIADVFFASRPPE